jgi:hypothetical protein
MGASVPSSINPYGEFSTNVWPISRIGLMRTVPGVFPDTYYMYFAYNPNQIQVSFATNTGQIPPAALYSSSQGWTGASSSTPALGSAASVPSFVGNQTVSWSLLFDRTYEMVYGDSPGTNRGVLKDVAALYNIMGGFVAGSGVPMSSPVEVVFGQTAEGDIWGFTGFVSSVNISYGIFRHDMIPSRCEIDLSLTAVYTGSGVATGGQTNSAGATSSSVTFNATGGNSVGVNTGSDSVGSSVGGG